MKRVKNHLYGILLLAFSVACSSEKQPFPPQPQLPTNEEVAAFYALYTQGDYAAFVAAMASCDDKPQDYRQQMEMLFKQHAAQTVREKGGIKAVSVGRMEPHGDNTMVNAFLDVTYQDSTTEEVMLPLVFVDNKWRLR